MTRRLVLAPLGVALLGLLGAADALEGRQEPKQFTSIDLQPKANHKLADPMGSGREGNDLKELPTGERTIAGIRFKIGEGFIQLHSELLQDQKPKEVTGIKVGQKFARLHLLHATGYGNGTAVGKEPDPNDALYVADGTKIAEYRVHYQDGKTETVPVVYGEDVRDWWFSKTTKGTTRGKVAWKGDNEVAKATASRIRLFRGTWENPRPDVRVTSIDYVKVGDNPATPFCVSMTVERK
jgi:hypothetical protein